MNILAAQADGIDMQTALYLTQREHQEAVDGLKSIGYALADARRRGRMELSKAMLGLRQSGVAASTVKDIARGRKAVADALFEEELQDALWEAQKEVVMMRKREEDILRDELARMAAEEGRRQQW